MAGDVPFGGALGHLGHVTVGAGDRTAHAQVADDPYPALSGEDLVHGVMGQVGRFRACGVVAGDAQLLDVGPQVVLVVGAVGVVAGPAGYLPGGTIWDLGQRGTSKEGLGPLRGVAVDAGGHPLDPCRGHVGMPAVGPVHELLMVFLGGDAVGPEYILGQVIVVLDIISRVHAHREAMLAIQALAPHMALGADIGAG